MALKPTTGIFKFESIVPTRHHHTGPDGIERPIALMTGSLRRVDVEPGSPPGFLKLDRFPLEHADLMIHGSLIKVTLEPVPLDYLAAQQEQKADAEAAKEADFADMKKRLAAAEATLSTIPKEFVGCLGEATLVTEVKQEEAAK